MKKNGIREIAFTLGKLILGSFLVALCPAEILAGDGVVALQSADPSCGAGSTATYVDCGNGTVTDNRTGLVWLQNPDCYGELEWPEAVEIVANLSDIPASSAAAAHDCGLSDGSSPGDWRLPSVSEWEAMVADAVDLGCNPTITSDLPAGITPCWTAGCSSIGLCAFSDMVSSFYWSSTTWVLYAGDAWTVHLGSGGVSPGTKAGGNSLWHVWPVRGGQ